MKPRHNYSVRKNCRRCGGKDCVFSVVLRDGLHRICNTCGADYVGGELFYRDEDGRLLPRHN